MAPAAAAAAAVDDPLEQRSSAVPSAVVFRRTSAHKATTERENGKTEREQERTYLVRNH